MSAPVLRVEDLTVEFTAPGGPLRAVDEVSFELAEGEVLGLVGESGSGKTLTCRALIRLLPSRRARITRGVVRVDGLDLMTLPESMLQRVRGERIGMIFQNPMTHLDPVMTIGEQIGESLRFHKGITRREAGRRAVELLRQVGIPDPALRSRSYPHSLSGGMRQRAMIAIALAGEPRILIADEPTTALDVTVQAQILRLLLDLRDRAGLSIILITHDLGVIAETCETVAVMYAGRIVERAAKRTLLREPLHPYSQGLIRSQPGAGAPLAELPSIPGQPPSLAELPHGCRFHPRCAYAIPRCREIRPPLADAGTARRSACLRWQELARPS
jgi:peptide/nickel transport system ATP-binding protein